MLCSRIWKKPKEQEKSTRQSWRGSQVQTMQGLTRTFMPRADGEILKDLRQGVCVIRAALWFSRRLPWLLPGEQKVKRGWGKTSLGGAGVVSVRAGKKAWIWGCGDWGRGRGLSLHCRMDGGAELEAESAGENAHGVGNDPERGVGYAEFEEPQRSP